MAAVFQLSNTRLARLKNGSRTTYAIWDLFHNARNVFPI
jgi:hypothetical protein